MTSLKNLKSMMLAVSMLLVASMCVSCEGRYTGGGFIDSAAGAPYKATFGFVIDASEPDASGTPTQVMGQFQYRDHGTGLMFHVNQLQPAGYAYILGGIFDPTAVMFAYSGTYTCSAGTGTLDVAVASHTQIFFGEQNQDALFVDITTGPLAGYSNSGLLRGGTIQFHAPN